MNFSEIVIGPFVFSTGAVFALLGMVASAWMLTRTIHEKKLSLRFLNDHLLFFIIAALVMGRAGAVLHIWPTIAEQMMYSSSLFGSGWELVRGVISFWQGGIDFIWALVGFFLTFVGLCLWNNENTLSWLDAFSLPLLLFLIFLEVGSFFAGWNYGKPVSENFWFAISYDLTDVRYSGYVHPVQLYAAISFFLLFLGGGFLWTKKIEYEWPSGIFGGILLSAIFVTSGVLEFFRGEPGKLLLEDSLPLSQVLFFFAGILIFVFMIWKGHFHVFSKFYTFSRSL